jgi:hypothetical protein
MVQTVGMDLLLALRLIVAHYGEMDLARSVVVS